MATFKELRIGDVFTFESERTMPFAPLAKGPWIKLSPRIYAPLDTQSIRHRVGTTSVRVDKKEDGSDGLLR